MTLFTKNTLLMATAIFSSSLLYSNQTPDTILMQAALNLKQSTAWDWAITIGSACGAAHGLYANNPDQATAWLISTIISLTGQLTQERIPLRMARFVAAGILVSYRTDLLAKIADQVYAHTKSESAKAIKEFFAKYPELSGAVAGIMCKLIRDISKA